MRILHTADWHLGKTFRGLSLLEDQHYILDQIFDAIKDHKIDVLIIAGDVYDKPSPSEMAVSLFNGFIERAYLDTNVAIVVIAGNHDSGHRLGALAKLYDPKRILIRGPLQAEEQTLIVHDNYGPVAFSAVPYGEIYAARKVFEDETIKSPEDVLRSEIAAAHASLPDNTRWVVVAHAFVTGGKTSEGERPLAVGTVETVSNKIFAGANYVALGHLHRAQSAGGDTIRYSGSPMAFGFDEVDDQKSITVVELGAGDACDYYKVKLQPLRHVREIRGLISDLIVEAAAEPSEDYIRAILLDEGALVDPASQLRPFYPNVLQILREKKRDFILIGAGRAKSKLNDPKAVIDEFIKFVRGEGVSEIENDV